MSHDYEACLRKTGRKVKRAGVISGSTAAIHGILPAVVITVTATLTASAAAAQGTDACTYQISPARQVVPQAGGWVFVELITQPDCAWSIAPFQPTDWTDAGYYGVRVGPGWITIHASQNTHSSPRTRRF